MKTRFVGALMVSTTIMACASTMTATQSGSVATQPQSSLSGAKIDVVQEGGFAALAIRRAVTRDDRAYVTSTRGLCNSNCGVPTDSASGTLTAGATDSLFAAIVAQDPFSLKDDYGVTKGSADMFRYTVHITANGKSKSVRFDDGSIPEPMQKILLALQTTLFAARR
jgi:hypothetical protein